ncbi:MAG: magnesium transporter [Phycisphaerae bacterium]|jgi:magnesium transporter
MATRDPRPWERLEALAEAGEPHALRQFLELILPGEAARVIARLTPHAQSRLFGALDPIDAARLVSELPRSQAAELIEHMGAELGAGVVAALPSDKRVDLLDALAEATREELISLLPPAEAREARELAEFGANTAGGLMIKEFLSYGQDVQVREVIDDLKRNAARYASYEVQYLYVVSAIGRLVGVVAVRRLLFASPETALSSIMQPSPLAVPVNAALDLLRALFERHRFIAVPVLDANHRMLGVVRRSAVEAATAERSERDYLKVQGIVGGEELRTLPWVVRARRRMSWLTVNIGLNILAASVIAFFQDTLSAVIALAVYLPIISDMSGCSGNQAVAVSLRELSLGLLKPVDVLRVWLKEASVGVINGAALGLLIAAVAWVWNGNPYLGLVVGAALGLNTFIAVSVGGTLPLVLKWLNIDPALASGPILTTVTDMCGFLLVLGLATLALDRLVSAAT